MTLTKTKTILTIMLIITIVIAISKVNALQRKARPKFFTHTPLPRTRRHLKKKTRRKRKHMLCCVSTGVIRKYQSHPYGPVSKTPYFTISLTIATSSCSASFLSFASARPVFYHSDPHVDHFMELTCIIFNNTSEHGCYASSTSCTRTKSKRGRCHPETKATDSRNLISTIRLLIQYGRSSLLFGVKTDHLNATPTASDVHPDEDVDHTQNIVDDVAEISTVATRSPTMMLKMLMMSAMATQSDVHYVTATKA